MSESTNAKSDGLAASPMDRRDFLKGAASAAGTVVAASVSETARATPASKPGVPWGDFILFACLSSSHVADIAIVLKQGQDSE